MAKKVITPATVENVTPATVEAPASAPATVETPATEKKINLKKEVKEMNKTAKTPATVETPATATAPQAETVTAPEAPASVPAPVAPVKVIKETDPVTVPALDIEAEKTRITQAIEVEKIRLGCYVNVDNEGERINPTNWGKNETLNGNPTLGGFVRSIIDETHDKIDSLKRELKCLYFTLDPVLVTLQNNENAIVKALVNDCVDNMRNVIVIDGKLALDPETLQILASAGVERVGVIPDLLGVALPVLGVAGYNFEPIPQPVEIAGKKIAGLDPVPPCVYYSFKKA